MEIVNGCISDPAFVFLLNLQFFDEGQNVDHSSVPRKLRSGL